MKHSQCNVVRPLAAFSLAVICFTERIINYYGSDSRKGIMKDEKFFSNFSALGSSWSMKERKLEELDQYVSVYECCENNTNSAHRGAVSFHPGYQGGG